MTGRKRGKLLTTETAGGPCTPYSLNALKSPKKVSSLRLFLSILLHKESSSIVIGTWNIDGLFWKSLGGCKQTADSFCKQMADNV